MTESEVDARCAAMLRRALDAIYPQNNYTPEARTLASYLDRIRATLPPSPQETQGQARCAFRCNHTAYDHGNGFALAVWFCVAADHTCLCGRRFHDECHASRTQAAQSAAAEPSGPSAMRDAGALWDAAAPATVAQPVSASGREAGRPVEPQESIAQDYDSRTVALREWIAYARSLDAWWEARYAFVNERCQTYADDWGRDLSKHEDEIANAEARTRAECVARLENVAHGYLPNGFTRRALELSARDIEALGPLRSEDDIRREQREEAVRYAQTHYDDLTVAAVACALERQPLSVEKEKKE